MYLSLEALKVKWDLLVIALRVALLKLLGVDALIERAFKEGWHMAHDDDFSRLQREVDVDPFLLIANWRAHVIGDVAQLREIVTHSRCWRSVDEAWVNSDAQEMFDENA